jgi:hypothetical protein
MNNFSSAISFDTEAELPLFAYSTVYLPRCGVRELGEDNI